MTQLNSTAIIGADYDSASRQMHLWFPNHGPYTFYRVPLEIYHGLLNAPSAGEFYHRYIRGRFGP